MKKKFMTIALTAAMAMTMGITAFAGQWNSDDAGWWWTDDNGSYPVNEWRWLDGNGDGIYECYYFGSDGYMLADTTTPDGHTVNQDGAWTVDRGVQLQYGEQAEAADVDSSSDLDDVFYTSSSYERARTYVSEDGDYIELNMGAGDSYAGMYYDEDGDFKYIYSFSKVKDNEYKDSTRSKTLKFLSDGTISIGDTIYY